MHTKQLGGVWRRLAVLLVACNAFACGDDDDSDHDSEHAHDAAVTDAGKDAATTDAESQRLEIEFEGRVGSETFDCTKTYEIGTAATPVRPLDFKLYVHDVKLITASGTEEPLELEQDGIWQRDDVALLDFENKASSCRNGTTATRTKVVGMAANGVYEGLSFKVGVPEALNHENQATAASPLNIEGMFWSWLSGYKFLRVDVAPVQGMMAADVADAGPGHQGGSMGFPVHLGSTMCTGNPMTDEGVTCKRENRPKARFARFDASTQKIVVDVAKLLSTTDVSKNGGGEPGCMSGPMDPDCSPVFERLGVDFATGESDSDSAAFLSIVGK